MKQYTFKFTTFFSEKELGALLKNNGIKPTINNIEKIASEICIDEIMGDSIKEQLEIAIEEVIEKSFAPIDN